MKEIDIMHTFPAAPVRAALLRDAHVFRQALADALPPEQMTFAAFALQARTILALRQGRMAGLAPVAYAAIEVTLPALCRECLPPEAAEEAVKMIEATAP